MKILVLLGLGLFVLAGTPVLADDVADGQTVFRQMCSTCHTATAGAKNGIGPNLFGVVGRKVGGAADYKYSAVLAADGGKWTADSLSTFLTAPQKVKPGTRMSVSVKDDAKRAKLLAYLASLKP